MALPLSGVTITLIAAGSLFILISVLIERESRRSLVESFSLIQRFNALRLTIDVDTFSCLCTIICHHHDQWQTAVRCKRAAAGWFALALLNAYFQWL